MWKLFTRAKDTPSPEGQTLSDMVRGIAHAAGAASEIAEQQVLKQLQYYFEVDEAGKLTAKTVRVQVSPTHHMDVPLISLIDPASLGLHEMKVRMAVRLSKSEVKSRLHAANGEAEVSRCSFHVALTGAVPGARKDVIDITMSFKRNETNEGVSRVIEEISRQLQPIVTPPPPVPLDQQETREEIVLEDDDS